jgi:hypothetical protein
LHDALLVEVLIEDLDTAIIEVPAIMRTAGRQILGDDSILDAKPYVIRPGECAVELIKPEALPIWETVRRVLET